MYLVALVVTTISIAFFSKSFPPPKLQLINNLRNAKLSSFLLCVHAATVIIFRKLDMSFFSDSQVGCNFSTINMCRYTLDEFRNSESTVIVNVVLKRDFT
jgi:hypothetical protein